MDGYLCIATTFLADRYHGREWPPSPARLFQALLAGVQTGSYRQQLATAEPVLRELECLPAPEVVASASRPLMSYRISVPNNDSDKAANQRTLLQRNHIEPRETALRQLKLLAEKAETAFEIDTLLGIEGSAARVYFGEFAGMLKSGEDGDSAHQGAPTEFSFDFTQRNRRPPRDPVNALLSLAYSILVKDLTITCYSLGFDPYWGFYHQPRFGRPALALDLMEPFRPLIADSVVLTAINTRMVTAGDFIRSGPAVALKPNGRKGFFRAYELRMDTLVTHPMFDYRLSYRRLLEIQARLLARFLNGEIDDYPVFVTR